jgi:hypothetical protein
VRRRARRSCSRRTLVPVAYAAACQCQGKAHAAASDWARPSPRDRRGPAPLSGAGSHTAPCGLDPRDLCCCHSAEFQRLPPLAWLAGNVRSCTNDQPIGRTAQRNGLTKRTRARAWRAPNGLTATTRPLPSARLRRQDRPHPPAVPPPPVPRTEGPPGPRVGQLALGAGCHQPRAPRGRVR